MVIWEISQILWQHWEKRNRKDFGLSKNCLKIKVVYLESQAYLIPNVNSVTMIWRRWLVCLGIQKKLNNIRWLLRDFKDEIIILGNGKKVKQSSFERNIKKRIRSSGNDKRKVLKR